LTSQPCRAGPRPQSLPAGARSGNPVRSLAGRVGLCLGALINAPAGRLAVLIGLADISEAAWRKRLRASNDWLLGLLGALSAVPTPSALAVPHPPGRRLWVEASCLGQPGGTGDDWRLPLAYDFLAGRMRHGQRTDRRGGERLARYPWRAGDVIVAAKGYGDRRRVAWAGQQQADVGVRMYPVTFPLATDAGQPFNVLRWLRQRGRAERAWRGGCRGQQQRYRVRLLAAKFDAPIAQRARARRGRKAQKAGQTITAPTLWVAGRLVLLTT
jgi:hypothetical protein